MVISSWRRSYQLPRNRPVEACDCMRIIGARWMFGNYNCSLDRQADPRSLSEQSYLIDTAQLSRFRALHEQAVSPVENQ
jgi:hypothetical protein